MRNLSYLIATNVETIAIIFVMEIKTDQKVRRKLNYREREFLPPKEWSYNETMDSSPETFF